MEQKQLVFNLCLNEANKLVTSKFRPALDSLETDNIDSIMYKVLTEFDLMCEGEIENMTKQDKQRKTAQVIKFFGKWALHVSSEERKMYENEIKRY